MNHKMLVLMRHGDAVSGSVDHERALSAQGRVAVESVARKLAQAGLAPQVILASDAARTRQTAAVLAATFSEAERRYCSGLYLAGSDKICREIRTQTIIGQAQCLLLVGHNPGISELGAACAPELAPYSFPTAAALWLQTDLERWDEFDPGRCSGYRFELPDF